MIRQSIVWRPFLHQWPFNVTYSWLASSGTEIQTGAFVTKCSGLRCFSPRYSIVHMHARPAAFTSVQSWYHTMHLVSHSEASASPISLGSAAPQQARYGCVIVRGDSWRLENKTGRPGWKRSPLARNADSRASMWVETSKREAAAIKTKINPKLRRFSRRGEK